MTKEVVTCGRRAVLRVVAVSGVSTLAGCLSASVGRESEDSDLQSTTHIHHAASSTADSDEETATQTPDSGDSDEYVLQEGGVRWDSFPVETVVGISTRPDDVSETAAKDAITAAFDAWNGVSEVGTVFAAPTFDDSLTEVTNENQANEFVWSSLDEGTIARATIYWDDETQFLEEVDIRLNQNVEWTTDSGDDDAYDVQSLATHEIGHHGLDDVTDSDAAEQTMYHESETGSTKKRTLEAGDVAGWQDAYGDVA